MTPGGAGAFIFGCSGPVLTPSERAFFADTRPLGFILFARNVVDPVQLRRLTSDLRNSAGYGAPVLIDQEGGRVQRMGRPHWRQWPPPLEQMAQAGPQNAARVMYLRARLIAEELREVGIDVNCLPVADVARPETHPFLKNRCYGMDADSVTQGARAVADGLLAGGVLPVLKHIPGHGAATADSHKQLPRVTLDRAALEAVDFAPFRALTDLPMGMTAHVVYDAIDPGAPGTTSARVISLIRDEIGFDGFLMSDDISMQALAGDLTARCVAAMSAGCDAVLHCTGDLTEMATVAAACGLLNDAAAQRAARALAAAHQPDYVDTDGLEAELAGLMGGATYG